MSHLVPPYDGIMAPLEHAEMLRHRPGVKESQKAHEPGDRDEVHPTIKNNGSCKAMVNGGELCLMFDGTGANSSNDHVLPGA